MAASDAPLLARDHDLCAAGAGVACVTHLDQDTGLINHKFAAVIRFVAAWINYSGRGQFAVTGTTIISAPTS